MLILTNQAKDRKQPAEPTETVQAATAACDKAAAPVAKEIETDGMQVKAVQPLKTRQEQQKTKPEGDTSQTYWSLTDYNSHSCFFQAYSLMNVQKRIDFFRRHAAQSEANFEASVMLQSTILDGRLV